MADLKYGLTWLENGNLKFCQGSKVKIWQKIVKFHKREQRFKLL